MKTTRDIYDIHEYSVWEYMCMNGFIVDSDEPFSFKGKEGVLRRDVNLSKYKDIAFRMKKEGTKNILNLR